MKHYKNAADALKATPSIRHVIFSTLEESVLPGVTDDFKVLHEHKEKGKMYDTWVRCKPNAKKITKKEYPTLWTIVPPWPQSFKK